MPIINLTIELSDRKARDQIDAIQKKLQQIQKIPVHIEATGLDDLLKKIGQATQKKNLQVQATGLDDLLKKIGQATQKKNVQVQATLDIDKFIADAKAKIPQFARDTGVKIEAELVLKKQVNIASLQETIQQAKNSLKDPELTGEKKIQLSASIVRLSQDLTEAKRQLNNYVNTGTDTLSRLQRKFDQVSGGLQGLGRVGEALATAGITAGLYAIGSGAVTLAGNLEQARIAFGTMLGSTEKAGVLLKDLSNFAANTPFELTGIREEAKKLTAYGVSANDIIPVLTSLGNISAGVGTEKLPFLTRALGQVKAKGVLAGDELKQFTETGVPLIGELAKVTGFAVSDIVGRTKDLGITYDQVRQALDNLGGSGGQFGGLMEAQSKTLQGSFSNLKDSLGQLGEQFGNIFLPVLTLVTQGITNITNNIRSFLEENPKLATAIGVVVAALSSLGIGIVGLGGIVGAITTALATLGLGLSATGVTATATATAVGTSTGIIASAISFLTGPIALGTAAIIGLYYAYKNNLGGTADFVDKWYRTISILFRQAGDIISKSIGPVLAWAKSFVGVISSSVGSAIQSFGGMSRIGGIIKQALDIALTVATFGMNKVISMMFSKLGQITGITNAIANSSAQASNELANIESARSKIIQGNTDKKSQLATLFGGGGKISVTKAKTITGGGFSIPVIDNDVFVPSDIGGGGLGKTKGSGGGGGSGKSKKDDIKTDYESIRKGADDLYNSLITKQIEIQKKSLEEVGKSIGSVISKQEAGVKKITDAIVANLKKIEEIDAKMKQVGEDTSKSLADRFIAINNEIKDLQAKEKPTDDDKTKLDKLNAELLLVRENTTEAERQEAIRVAGLSTTQKLLESRDKEINRLQEQKLQIEEQTKILTDNLRIQDAEYQKSILIRNTIEEQLKVSSLDRWKQMTIGVQAYIDKMKEAGNISFQSDKNPGSIVTNDNKTVNISQIINNSTDSAQALDGLERIF